MPQGALDLELHHRFGTILKEKADLLNHCVHQSVVIDCQGRAGVRGHVMSLARVAPLGKDIFLNRRQLYAINLTLRAAGERCSSLDKGIWVKYQ